MRDVVQLFVAFSAFTLAHATEHPVAASPVARLAALRRVGVSDPGHGVFVSQLVWLIARILQKIGGNPRGGHPVSAKSWGCQDSVERRSAAPMKPAPPVTIACISCKS